MPFIISRTSRGEMPCTRHAAPTAAHAKSVSRPINLETFKCRKHYIYTPTNPLSPVSSSFLRARQIASRGRCRRQVMSNDLFDPGRGVRRAPALKSHQSSRAHADAPAHSCVCMLQSNRRSGAGRAGREAMSCLQAAAPSRHVPARSARLTSASLSLSLARVCLRLWAARVSTRAWLR